MNEIKSHSGYLLLKAMLTRGYSAHTINGVVALVVLSTEIGRPKPDTSAELLEILETQKLTENEFMQIVKQKQLEVKSILSSDL